MAGFLDGDGSVYVRAKPNPTYRYGFQVALYIVLYQSKKSKKNFAKVCALIGYGNLRERNDGVLEYIINKIDDVQDFLQCIRPFVILKHKQVELMLTIIEAKRKIKKESDFNTLLELIDSYRELNYSKKRKIRNPVET